MLITLSHALAASSLFLSVSAGSYRLCCCSGFVTKYGTRTFTCDEDARNTIVTAGGGRFVKSPHLWYTGNGAPYVSSGYVSLAYESSTTLSFTKTILFLF